MGLGEFWAGLGDVFLLNSRNQGLSFRFKYCVQVRWVQSHLDIKYLVRVPLAIPLVNTSVQFSCSGMSDSAPPGTAACQASLSITNSRSLLNLTSIESMMLSNHLILSCPLLLLPSICPSIRVFSSGLAVHIRWPKYWSFSFSISPSNECSVLISFRSDCFDLLTVQGTLKSLLQYHSSKASIFWPSAFFMVQLSHLYVTT